MPTKSRALALSYRVWTVGVQINGDIFPQTTGRTWGPYTQSATYGSNVSGYKRLIKSGLSATTPFTGKLLEVLNPGFMTAFASLKDPAGWPATTIKTSTLIGNVHAFEPARLSMSPVSSSEYTKVENAAVMAFVRKAKAVTRSFQGGVFLGELGEAIRMIKRPASSLRAGVGNYLTSLNKARRGLRSPPSLREANLLRIARESWLEYSFGWSPLIRDVETGAEALAKAKAPPDSPKTKFVSGVGKLEVFDSTDYNNGVGPHPFVALSRQSIVRTVKVRYYGAVRAFNPADVPFRHFGVNLSEFIPTAWELVPWSFLVDYFANIGDILEAATLCRSDIGWVNRSSLDTIKVSYGNHRPVPNSYYNITYVGGNQVFRYSEKSRGAYTGLLIPSLEFRVPGTGRKLANVTALLPQLRRLTPFR